MSFIFPFYNNSDFPGLPQDTCHICYALKKLFLDLEPELSIMVWDNPRARNVHNMQMEDKCEAHKPFLSWIIDLYLERQSKDLERNHIHRSYDPTRLRFSRQHGFCPKVEILDYKRRPRKSYELLLRKPQEKVREPFATALNPLWVDLRLAKLWMNRCIAEHGSSCPDHNSDKKVLPDWVIDTKNNSLVRGETIPDFVALSYRWGNVASKQSRDLDQLTKPGGLCRSGVVNVPTIRDAIHVVQAIGERYLWVDAVCIVQKDESHLANQLQLMGAIYASAKLVIVATDGDALQGLRGLKGCSGPRNLKNTFKPVEPLEIVVRDLPVLAFGPALYGSEYFHRGWTFQEYFMSRRRLVFGKQQIHWSCKCASWHEDLPEMNTNSGEENINMNDFPNIRRGQPDLGELSQLIRQYNDLELKYPEDALPGIAGLLRVISPSFKGGFLFGVPKVCFEASLMWGGHFGKGIINSSRSQGLQRLERSTRSNSLLPDSKLPSWSWIGWKGSWLRLQENEEDFRVSNAPDRFPGSHEFIPRWITLPITRWYSHATPNSNTRESIDSCWLEHHSRKGGSPSLREGWIEEQFDHPKHLDTNNIPAKLQDVTGGFRYKIIDYHTDQPQCLETDHTPIIPWGVTGKNVYRHTDFPNDYYWRPFPINAGTQTKMMVNARQDQFVSCKTKRGWFRAHRDDKLMPTDLMTDITVDCHLILVDNSDNTCGVLQLPSDEEASYFPESHEPNFTIELVAICRRLRSLSIEKTGFLKYQEFYGVLWVKWESGIAYRRGFGYVEKEAWENYELSDVDLILG